MLTLQKHLLINSSKKQFKRQVTYTFNFKETEVLYLNNKQQERNILKMIEITKPKNKTVNYKTDTKYLFKTYINLINILQSVTRNREYILTQKLDSIWSAIVQVNNT